MKKSFFIENETEQVNFGKKIGSLLKKGSVILLDGDLGAGKTTLVKGIGEALGVKRVINSPTFTIMKSYKGLDITLNHFDFYRLDSVNNDFDLLDYINSDSIAVIEWPYQVIEFIPKTYLLIKINYLENGRNIEVISDFEEYNFVVEAL